MCEVPLKEVIKADGRTLLLETEKLMGLIYLYHTNISLKKTKK